MSFPHGRLDIASPAKGTPTSWINKNQRHRRPDPLPLSFIFMRVAPTGAHVWIGRGFFSWTSVFNLFVVSVFWAFMADIFRWEQGSGPALPEAEG